MPPPPVPQWSRPVNGLRCGLIIDPEEFTVGEQVAVQLRFENTTNKSINLYYKSTDALKRIAIDNGNGQTLELQSAGGRSSRRRGRGGSPIQTIAPGQPFETEIEAKVVAGPGKEAFAAGQFHAVYNLEVNDETLAQVEPAPKQAVWTGKLTSGKYALSVNSAPPVGCADCHGGEDYHHKLDEDCEDCHVGEVGTDEFDVKKEACGQCHPREGVQGRRQILGPGGEFEMASRHIPGKLEDKHCLMCHDNSKHRNGVVSLIDPDSEGTEPWTGSRTDFCLACHDGEPPEGVSFPTQSKGTGFDKMMFLGSRLSQTKEGCSYCHLPHGSPYPSLLKNLHAH
ncbi:MAG: cytochrome c3 family protein [Planctomycetota bacterium]